MPGETRIKARGLKPKGERFATTDQAEAQELARGIWESAIRCEVQARARAKAREKAKAMAEEMAKVEAQATQTVAKMKAGIAEALAKDKAEYEEKLRRSNQALVRAQEQATLESQKRAEAEAKLEDAPSRAKRTGTCDCCGKADVPEDELSRIDSGQSICMDCLSAMRG